MEVKEIRGDGRFSGCGVGLNDPLLINGCQDKYNCRIFSNEAEARKYADARYAEWLRTQHQCPVAEQTRLATLGANDKAHSCRVSEAKEA